MPLMTFMARKRAIWCCANVATYYS